MLISIIVPIYNVEKYIHKCINSIINQTYKNIEVILVDDGSTDRCSEICDEFAKKDNRIKVIHQKNSGLSEARNTGIENSSGEYLLFIDSDDYIEVCTCEHLIKCLSKEKVDIIQFKKRIYFENKPTEILDKDISSTNHENYKVYNRSTAYDMYMNNKEFTREAWDKLYSKKLFDNIKFPKDRLAEDLATTYKLILNSNKLAVLDIELYNYLIRSNSIMGQKSIKLMEDACKGHLEIYNFNKVHYRKYIKVSLSNYFNNLVKLYCRLDFLNKKEYEYRLKEIEDIIKGIKLKEINLKSKLVFLLLKLNKKIFFKVIYKKI